MNNKEGLYIIICVSCVVVSCMYCACLGPHLYQPSDEGVILYNHNNRSDSQYPPTSKLKGTIHVLKE